MIIGSMIQHPGAYGLTANTVRTVKILYASRLMIYFIHAVRTAKFMINVAFFDGMDDVPNEKETIKMWLESEIEE